MKYYAVFLPMLDRKKSERHRPEHLEYISKLRDQGRIFAAGRFTDGSGGLVIYRAESLEEVHRLVEKDPYVVYKARNFHIHEWDMTPATPE